MTEQTANALAATVGGNTLFPMPGSRSWGVTLDRLDGSLAVIEDHAGWLYRDRTAFDTFHRDGEQDGMIQAYEWGEWNDGEVWARGLSMVLGSGEYWQSGGNIWLVFYPRPDGRFAVIGTESGGVYASREQFEADEFGEKAENHVFV